MVTGASRVSVCVLVRQFWRRYGSGQVALTGAEGDATGGRLIRAPLEGSRHVVEGLDEGSFDDVRCRDIRFGKRRQLQWVEVFLGRYSRSVPGDVRGVDSEIVWGLRGQTREGDEVTRGWEDGAGGARGGEVIQHVECDESIGRLIGVPGDLCLCIGDSQDTMGCSVIPGGSTSGAAAVTMSVNSVTKTLPSPSTDRTVSRYSVSGVNPVREAVWIWMRSSLTSRTSGSGLLGSTVFAARSDVAASSVS